MAKTFLSALLLQHSGNERYKLLDMKLLFDQNISFINYPDQSCLEIF